MTPKPTPVLQGFLLFLLVSGSPIALAQETFHSGGVGRCSGCHSLHGRDASAGGSYLLRGSNTTDTCLSCHEIQHGNTWGGSLLAPGPVYGGGSFIFLTEDNINDGPGGGQPANWIPGHRAGHNVISPLRGVSQDPVNTTSPGGGAAAYPSVHLTCTSCHDPHGKAGNYRMLYANNSPPSRSDGYVYAFTVPPPTGIGIPLHGPPESRTNHAAYRSGWGDWCGQCHDQPHQGSAASFRHPLPYRFSSPMRTHYDLYEGTGFLSSGNPQTSYLPEVPYQSAGMTTSFTGPTPMDAEVICLSCHRAHASSAPYAGRWDFNIDTWASEGVVSGSYPIPNPYDTTSGLNQRSLCEKCHRP